MAATYDPDTSAGRVRLLIADTNVANEATRLFSDAEIEAFLDLEGSIYLAAALALESLASSEVMIQKRIKLLELTTDGPAQAKELRAIAAGWRARATELVEEEIDEDATGFAIAELAITPSQRHDVITNGWLRG